LHGLHDLIGQYPGSQAQSDDRLGSPPEAVSHSGLSRPINRGAAVTSRQGASFLPSGWLQRRQCSVRLSCETVSKMIREEQGQMLTTLVALLEAAESKKAA